MTITNRHVDYRKTSDQDFLDAIGGAHVAKYVGRCVVCGRTIYQAQDYHYNYGKVIEERSQLGNPYDPDPRGTINVLHACDSLVAEEYGYSGNDVRICFDCSQTRELYNRALEIAKSQWTEVEK